ncbi:hypothetical protein NDU88_000208 [Pleurodeles waltl]|uniref:Transmembrane protein 207 n=1 Tax=Pleurodeles waltl TaxID=8319 RepID=A0AAV7LDZ4_PLEWA|nr:hypothetical protein NDU88_000208 [Pleurodeles waltl]
MRPSRPAQHLVFSANTVLGLFQVASSDPRCSDSETCVGYNEEHFSVWYVWFCLMLLLLLVVFCLVLICLQCWLKRHSTFAARRTLTVVALNDSDPIYVTETSQGPLSGAHGHCQNLDPSFSHPVAPMSALGIGEPPSYDDVIKSSKS